VTYTLTASEFEWALMDDVSVRVWGYNCQMPGPEIRAREGDTIRVTLENDLPIPTTIHWHGLRIPAAMDGAVGHSQSAIEPGASFDYDFILPDAGTFWYHPHFDSAAQVGNGLYGPIIVDDPAEPPGLGDEVVMVLSDASVSDSGQLEPADAGDEFGTLFGREGNLILVNGRVNPTIHARAGLRQRWRLINTAKTRYFQLGLAGHDFTRIGGDGGLLTAPVEVSRPVLTPGERADLLIVPEGEEGAELVVRWIPFDRGFGSTFNRPNEDMFIVRLEGARAETPTLPEIRREIAPLATAGATPINLSLDQVSTAPFKLGVNGVAFEDSEPIMAHIGETQVWTVTNTIDFAHPFHLHGFFFQVLSPTAGPLDPLDPLEWKDTVNVPVDGTVQLAVRYDDRPGMWMFHCHILDHAEAGMMGSLMVGEHQH